MESVNKKLCIGLAAVFIVLLVLGIAVNTQQGLEFQDDFWRVKKDGRYVGPSGNWVRAVDDASFEMELGGERMTAELAELPDGGFRMDFSGGWAIEWTEEDAVWFGAVGRIWGEGVSLILTDVDAGNYEFAKVVRTERWPFYSASTEEEPIGETIHWIGENGDSLYMQEVWFDQPEYSTPEPQVLVLEDGMRLPEDSMQNYIIQNEDGEYLVNADQLRYVPVSDTRQVAKNAIAGLLLQVAEGEKHARGAAAVVFGYILIYILGAVQILMPEKMTFFGSRWMFRNEPELSEDGRTWVCISGGIVIGISIILLFLPLGMA